MTRALEPELLGPPSLLTGRLVIAGTGTGVGKTYAGSHLITSAPPSSVFGIKPIESGFDLPTSDAAKLAKTEPSAPLPRYALPDPVSPHLAARRAGMSIELTNVVRWVREREAERPDQLCMVETAGGLFTPLAEVPGLPGRPITNLDMILALQPCRWILVAPDRLGVLNDVLTARQASQRELGYPDAILLTNSEGPNELDNLGELRRFCQEPVLSVSPTSSLFERLRNHLETQT